MRRFAFVLLLVLLTALLFNFTGSKDLVETFDGNVYTDESNSSRIYNADRMEAVVGDPEILNVSLFDQGLYVYSRIQGLKRGETWVEYRIADTGETILRADFSVLANHTVINHYDGNFSNWKILRFFVLGLMILLTLVLWESFFFAQKHAKYSYHSIFCCGFGIWMLVADITQARYLFTVAGMMRTVYSVIQRSPCVFLEYSVPFVLLFAIAMSISNVSLIRREGFRIANVLGIGISVAMVIGAAVFYMHYYMISLPTVIENKILMAGCSIYAALYCMLECFLIGSVICGIRAAKHEPAYDKDYLVILGCGIKKDGTLYPLLRGRVDRAIEFQKKQLEMTGKKAVFVPSGGKGGDEPIAEGDAMKRYLLEQGYTEEDIMVENQSKNTIQNMAFSKKLIEERNPEAKAAFSTTNYHVFRSGILARQNEFYADGMGSNTRWFFWPNAFVREMIGMITYCWKSLMVILIVITAFFAFLAFA